MSIMEWPLQEADITESACKRCAICCEIEIKPNWKDPRQMEWLRAIVDKHDHIKDTEKGIRIRCSHLKGDDAIGYRCGIYDKRAQMCRDFNCVSWAKVSNDLSQYNKVIRKLGII